MKDEHPQASFPSRPLLGGVAMLMVVVNGLLTVGAGFIGNHFGYPLLFALLGAPLIVVSTIAIGLTVCTRLTVRSVLWLLTNIVYRLRVIGVENIPSDSGALLVSNHLSFVDGVLLQVLPKRPIRFLVYEPLTKLWWSRWLSSQLGIIPIKTTPKSIRSALSIAREAVQNGELVLIFPEGGISRTGQLLPFRSGLLNIVRNTGVPVVPIHLGGLWGSIFSFSDGKFFWKWPRRLRYPVMIRVGEPILEPKDSGQVRRQVEQLQLQHSRAEFSLKFLLPRAFVRQCRKSRKKLKVADSTGTETTGGELLMRTLILRRLLSRVVFEHDERFVGLLLPPSVPSVLSNAALAIDGRVSVNLNYTLSSQLLNTCIKTAGIRHVLTSRKVMAKLDLDIDAELIYLEDMRKHLTWRDKLAGALLGHVIPVFILERLLGLTKIKDDDLLTLIFTSGSTGIPKGVMLSHKNVASNVQAMDQIIRLSKEDTLIGVLPFFHSYGYTATMWTVLSLPPRGVYHFNPLEAKQVGELCLKYKGTVFLATPTFLRTYLRRCTREQFQSLEVLYASAERLSPELSKAFGEKLGVSPQEAYGATELSPLVAANIPEIRSPFDQYPTSREGSVGRPIPGVIARILDPISGKELPTGESGMLWIAGPNVMLGYYKMPEKTAEVLHDGWYKTGDLACLDGDGFLTITGRESRFSKIGGEMVPHGTVEDALSKALGLDEDEIAITVTAVPDPKKGERLVVLHKHIDKSVDDLRQALVEQGFPNLWIPSTDGFVEVEEIPVLGTGKLDLKAIRELAANQFSQASSKELET